MRDRRKSKERTKDFQKPGTYVGPRGRSVVALTLERTVSRLREVERILDAHPGVRDLYVFRSPPRGEESLPEPTGPETNESGDAVEVAESMAASEGRGHAVQSLGDLRQRDEDAVAARFREVVRVFFQKHPEQVNPIIIETSGLTLAEYLCRYARTQVGWGEFTGFDEEVKDDLVTLARRCADVQDPVVFVAQCEKVFLEAAAGMEQSQHGEQRQRMVDKRFRNGKRQTNFDWASEFDPLPWIRTWQPGLVRDLAQRLVAHGMAYRLIFEEFRESTLDLIGVTEESRREMSQLIQGIVRERNLSPFLSAKAETDYELTLVESTPVVRPLVETDLNPWTALENRAALARHIGRFAEEHGMQIPQALIRWRETVDKNRRVRVRVYEQQDDDLLDWVQKEMVDCPGYAGSDAEAAVHMYRLLHEAPRHEVARAPQVRLVAATIQAVMNLQPDFLRTMNPLDIKPLSYREIAEEYCRANTGPSLSEEVQDRTIRPSDVKSGRRDHRNIIGARFTVQESKFEPRRWVRVRFPSGCAMSLEHFVNSQGGGRARLVGNNRSNYRAYNPDSDWGLMQKLLALIASEDASAPLSDMALKNQWVKSGLGFAPSREAIKKLRGRLGIPSSHKRKRCLMAFIQASALLLMPALE